MCATMLSSTENSSSEYTHALVVVTAPKPAVSRSARSIALLTRMMLSKSCTPAVRVENEQSVDQSGLPYVYCKQKSKLKASTSETVLITANYYCTLILPMLTFCSMELSRANVAAGHSSISLLSC